MTVILRKASFGFYPENEIAKFKTRGIKEHNAHRFVYVVQPMLYLHKWNGVEVLFLPILAFGDACSLVDSRTSLTLSLFNSILNVYKFMIIKIILLAALFYVVWNSLQKNQYSKVRIRQLLYLPILQIIICLFFYLLSYANGNILDFNLMNEYANNELLGENISMTLSAMNIGPDSNNINSSINDLHQKANYILMGSIIMTFLQIFFTVKKKIDINIILGISIIHTICIFYLEYIEIYYSNYLFGQLTVIQIVKQFE